MVRGVQYSIEVCGEKTSERVEDILQRYTEEAKITNLKGSDPMFRFKNSYF